MLCRCRVAPYLAIAGMRGAAFLFPDRIPMMEMALLRRLWRAAAEEMV